MLMDSGTVNGRPFFVTTGIGFDGRVASHFAGSKKRGLSAYVTSVLALLKDLAPFMAEVRMEGPEGSIKRSGLYSLLVTANAEQYGNNAYIAPGALLNDGLLNLTAIGPVNLLQAGQLGRSLFSKTLASHSLVECLPATNVQIITHKPQFFHLDGEPCGKETTFNIEVRKHSLRVLASLKRYH
jgi:diacylglycerol kinase family enzyme